MARAQDLLRFQAGQLLQMNVQATNGDAAATRVEAHLASERRWREIAALEQDLRRDDAAQRLWCHQRFANESVEAGVSRANHSEPRVRTRREGRDVAKRAVRDALERGRYRAFGEVSNQYQGFDPSDLAFAPYIAVAEELDIPMSIHVGTGPPGVAYLGSPKCRARLHSPLTIEEALMKHPKLRVSLMHAGWPMLDDLLAVM